MSGGADDATVECSQKVKDVMERFGVDEKTAVNIMQFSTEIAQKTFNKWYANTMKRINGDADEIYRILKETKKHCKGDLKPSCVKLLEKAISKVLDLCTKL